MVGSHPTGQKPAFPDLSRSLATTHEAGDGRREPSGGSLPKNSGPRIFKEGTGGRKPPRGHRTDGQIPKIQAVSPTPKNQKKK